MKLWDLPAAADVGVVIRAIDPEYHIQQCRLDKTHSVPSLVQHKRDATRKLDFKGYTQVHNAALFYRKHT